MRTWHLTGIHIHFTNSQLGKHCCNFTDKQPTNTTYSHALLCFWGYPIQKDLLSCHRQWIHPCTFTQSPGITNLTKKKGSSINLVIKSWFLYHIAQNFCSRITLVDSQAKKFSRKNIGGLAVFNSKLARIKVADKT